MVKVTYLPLFVTLLFRGMPGISFPVDRGAFLNFSMPFDYV